ncbi:Protein eva-1 homolog C [Eumeta japonica]|uniref:Protein eva-1 homolog C n=1 Tax=Eumeta variegata TaxID=151549 RepID=A0A4C1VRZ1_EUMVA|nr:Protein eva-1 homolog C [Eumeta japonica]
MRISGSTPHRTVSFINSFVFILAKHDEIRKEPPLSFFLVLVEAKLPSERVIKCKIAKQNKLFNQCNKDEFRTKTGCEHDSVALNCNPGSRVAILEARYGRNSFEAGQCPQPPGVPDEDIKSRCINASPFPIPLENNHESAPTEMKSTISEDPRRGYYVAAKENTIQTPGPEYMTGEFAPLLNMRQLRGRRTRGEGAAVTNKIFDNESRLVRGGAAPAPCLNPYATQTVIQQCHGKRRCDVTADSTTFGSPCRSNTRTYLKIVYTCVPLGVLESKYESPPEPEEMHLPTWPDTKNDPGLFDDTGVPGERWSEPTAVPPAPAVINPVLQPHPHSSTPSPQTTGEYVPEINQKNDLSKENGAYTFVYAGAAVTVVFVVIAIAVSVKCYYLRKTKRQTKSPDVFATDVPNVFSDGISDIDNDIDVSHISGTFYDPVHPDMILYRDANRGSLRAVRPMSTIYPCAGASMYGNVDYVPAEQRRRREDEDKDAVVSPKSLSRYSTSQFYYG